MRRKAILTIVSLCILTLPVCAYEYHGQKDRYNEYQFRNDPEVLQSSGNSGQLVSLSTPKQALSEMPSFSSGETPIQKLDKLIKGFTYDPTAKPYGTSRMPEQVQIERAGNCFEVARLAFFTLIREGYNAHMVNIKTTNSKDWHTICVFQELDGGWSYFQATSEGMGFYPTSAPSVEMLVKSQFNNVEDIKVIL